MDKVKVAIDTELLVNKKSACFIEKLLNHFGVDVEHTIYKDIVYGNIYPKTKNYEFIKNLYDSYKYLLLNRKSLFCPKTIKKFYYILTDSELDEHIIYKLINKYYTPHTMDFLEHTIEMYFFIDEVFKNAALKEYISYLYLNSMLVSNDVLPIRFIYKQFIEFESSKEEYKRGNKKVIYETLLKFIIEEKIQPKSYYENLREVTFKDIINGIRNDKDILYYVYHIKSIALYGSFLHNQERLDSDIDLLVEFNDDISYKTKETKKKELEDYLYYKFGRYIDILELNNSISDRLIEIIKNAKIIY